MTKKSEVPATKNHVELWLVKNRERLLKLLPRHLNVERLELSLLSCVLKRPKLLQCTKESMFVAIKHCFELGLEPDTPLQHCTILPFNNKGTLEATFIPMYKGMIHLAIESEVAVDVKPGIVYSKDKFEQMEGTNAYLNHVPCNDDNPGEKIGAYCIVEDKDGRRSHGWVPRRKIMGIMAKSPAGAKGPWGDKVFEEDMWMKTAVKQTLKYKNLSKKSESLAKAIEIDDQLISKDSMLEDTQTKALSDDVQEIPESTETTKKKPEEYPEPENDGATELIKVLKTYFGDDIEKAKEAVHKYSEYEKDGKLRHFPWDKINDKRFLKSCFVLAKTIKEALGEPEENKEIITPEVVEDEKEPEYISHKQKNVLYDMAGRKGYKDILEVNELIKEKFQVESTNKLPVEYYENAVEFIKNLKKSEKK